MKIPVQKTWDENEKLYFDEADVRKACKRNECDEEMMEGCIEGMKEGLADAGCMSCYAELIDMGAELEYRPTKATREHIDAEHCWCEPELDYEDPMTGVRVWVHRETQ